VTGIPASLRLSSALAVAVLVGLGADTEPVRAVASPSSPPVVCPRLAPAVEIAFGIWGGPGTGVKRELFALVGSRGARREGGYAIFGSATPTSAEVETACARSNPVDTPSLERLSKPYSYRRAGANVYFQAKDGERLLGGLLSPRSATLVHLRLAYGVSFSCVVGSRIAVRIKDLRDGERVVGSELRVLLGRKLLATAAVRARGDSYFRISRRCERG